MFEYARFFSHSAKTVGSIIRVLPCIAGAIFLSFNCARAAELVLAASNVDGGGRIMLHSPHVEVYERDSLFAEKDLLWFRSEGVKANWAASGFAYRGALPFKNWLASASENLPRFDIGLSLNCWEFIYYTALRAKLLSKARLVELDALSRSSPLNFQRVFIGEEPKTLEYVVEFSNGKPRVKFSNLPRPAFGDLILMDGRSHVVVATGKFPSGLIEVVSFSPLPIWGDGQMTGGMHDVEPQVTTLESLIENLALLYPDVPSDWDSISLYFGPSKLFSSGI